MESIGILYAIITVMAWGTWLAPSQKVELPNPQVRALYVALGNLLLAGIALLVVGVHRLTGQVFLFPFLGGLIWALSGLCAFAATNRIGMAKAFGTWAPLNIIFGIIWGMVLFGEFLKSGMVNQLLAVVSVLVIIGGILLIVFSGGIGSGEKGKKDMLIGFGGALGAGVLWGTYFVPTAYLARMVEGVNDWVTAFPLAVGMFVGSAILVAIAGKAPKLGRTADYGRVFSSGLLWSVGNFAMLLMVGRIGMGKGFTIAQLCVVVNALVGIFLFKEPAPKSRAAALTLIGIVLATIGGVVLGNLKEGM